MENLNIEINLERKRKKLIDKNREAKIEKLNLIRALNNLYLEIHSLYIDYEILKDFDKIMNTEEHLKRILNEDHSTKGSKKKGKKDHIEVDNDKIISDYRVKFS